MPPCVRIRPSSTVISPGPTCFQPVRSLPLKSGFHSGVVWARAANAHTASDRHAPAKTQASVTFVLLTVFSPRVEARALKAQVAQIVVADLDVFEGLFRVVILHEIMFDAALFGGREDVLEVDRPFANVG